MDVHNPQQRSFNMSRIRSKNTGIERLCFDCLRKEGIYFVKHHRKIAGNPDIAIPSKKKAVFIHSDFWHGWQFPRWKYRLPSKFWKTKIEGNRLRDRKNVLRLKKEGWKILIIWSHELNRNLPETTAKLIKFLK